MAYETVLTETRGEVRVLTMNRPDRLNAWTPQMGGELADAITDANDDPDIGAIVLTGAGRGFCAGADMSDTFQTRIDGEDPGEDTAHGQGGFPRGIDWVALCRRSKPLVAAVNGAAVGIGTTQVLPFDSIVASADHAKFGMAFIKNSERAERCARAIRDPVCPVSANMADGVTGATVHPTQMAEFATFAAGCRPLGVLP